MENTNKSVTADKQKELTHCEPVFLTVTKKKKKKQSTKDL